MNAAEAPGWPEEFAARYREAGYWNGQTFGELLADRAHRSPDRVAVIDGTRRWTYRELDERANAIADGLAALGIRRGDKVVVQLPNIGEYYELLFALFRLGALPVFALPAHRFAEIGYFCEFTEAVAYVIADRHGGFRYTELADKVTAAVPGLRHVIVVGEAGPYLAYESLAAKRATGVLSGPSASDLAFLQLSGGSTGTPKLIPRTHDDYLYSVRESARICELTEDSIYLVVLPAAHNFPMSSPGSLGVFFAGGTVVLAPSPAPDVAFPLIESERVTITAVVPPLALAWLRAAETSENDLSSLRVLQVGGAKFSEEAARRVGPELGVTLQQVFGMAEGLVNYTRLDDSGDVLVSTQGRPISPDDEIRIVDDEDRDLPRGTEGNLLTRGPYTIRGYYRAAEHNASAFTEDGFYRTGDVVRMTEEGNLVVEGRAKDQINRGGEKVAAEEVENHLLANEAVHDVAVVSMPDDFLGERTCAFVIPASGAEPKPVTLRRFLRERGLADYKLPDRIRLVAEFPSTPVGKVSKAALRRAITEALRRKEF
ncbi:(2,3-dihydroxybenzoyl)adenylate synthase [Prauserella marina]|uniref:2,3-dihydroxybenzoate-AMP ligase n=1 Tax=Prauserella marina TaxID=530584 RepID=A0A222VU68_9PSEU|nr:(2,3-dihydroxybenzoyl)adenylate synthase [Prauserella marina]ASR37273.1 (2,3-dihydroxybenzoyl)adenylate synthase [Prauserella marina]PWV72608.1 2,3-dihydroxybenzoate-AMP ligase [Prauserella marina]SDD76106.1 2,3-dihydroxybenzoate-AMP ligase [Prauserella marina]